MCDLFESLTMTFLVREYPLAYALGQRMLLFHFRLILLVLVGNLFYRRHVFDELVALAVSGVREKYLMVEFTNKVDQST